MVNRTVSITKKQAQFLEDHPEINFSAVSRQALDRYIALFEKVETTTLDQSLLHKADNIEIRVDEDVSNGDAEVETIEIVATPIEDNE